MHLLILGGNGRTGQLIVDEALRRGHTIMALVRSPDSMKPRAGLSIMKGSPLNLADLEAVATATKNTPSVIIVALNARRKTDSPFSKPIAPPRMMADSVDNAVAVMKTHGIEKLVVMAAFGVGDSFSSLNYPMRLVISYSNMAAQFKDHGLVDEEVKRSGVRYVLARPAMLNEKDTAPIKVLGDQGQGASFMPSISRKSVAKFLLDAAETDQWDNSTPVICN